MSSSTVVSTLLTLLETPSQTGTEESMQRLILDLLEGRFPGISRDGWSSSRTSIKAHQFRKSLVVFVTPKGAEGHLEHPPRFVLLGHTDTVPGAWAQQVKPHIEGDRIIGLGASDMKSGLACMLELLSLDQLDALAVPIAFVFYAGEEGPGANNELGPLYQQFPSLLQAELSIFAEPTDRTIQVGCLGLANIRVTFHGKAAHSARPWNGVNAIHRAGDFIKAVGALEPRRVKIGAVEYVEVTSITMAHGGTATNVVPASFELNVNARVVPGGRYEDRVESIRELAGSNATVEVTDHQPAGRVPACNALYDRFRSTVQLPEVAKQAYTDVGLLSELGVQAINFGPGRTEQCHVVGEYALVSDVEWYLAQMQRFFREQLCKL